MTERQAGAEEVPPGYKRTEAGVIPEDWSIEQLLNVLHLPTGQVNPCREPYRSMILVAPDHIESATGRLLVKETAAEQQAISGKYQFKAGDIVYSKIRPYLRKVILADFDGLCSADMYPLTATRAVSPGFMLAVLLSHNFSTFAEAASARSGIPKINRNELAEYRVALPPLPEQRAIAAALSDADGLIGALDALIAKKRAIKQAAMQQLLTGKKRLPGFCGEWRQIRLGEMAQFLKGAGLSKVDLTPGGSNRCIHYGQLFTTYGERIDSVVSGTSHEGSFHSVENDVLMPTSDVTPNGLATASCVELPDVIIGGDILVIRIPKNNINGVFLAYTIRLSHERIMQLVSGTTVFHLYGRDMANFVFAAPDIEEQAAIVEVLSDIDAEIAALERRREKAEQIKQGMMQQLLTGRIRLVEPPEAAA